MPPHLPAEMTGTETLNWGSTFRRRLLMAVDAVPYGRGEAFDDVVRPGGVSLREPDFRLVAVAVKEYSAEACLRVPGLRPDELVVDRARATAGDAAGDLPGPPGEAGVPCGGRDAGATPFAESATAQAWVLRASSS
jgi:hypothetical protein